MYQCHKFDKLIQTAGWVERNCYSSISGFVPLSTQSACIQLQAMREGFSGAVLDWTPTLKQFLDLNFCYNKKNMDGIRIFL